MSRKPKTASRAGQPCKPIFSPEDAWLSSIDWVLDENGYAVCTEEQLAEAKAAHDKSN